MTTEIKTIGLIKYTIILDNSKITINAMHTKEFYEWEKCITESLLFDKNDQLQISCSANAIYHILVTDTEYPKNCEQNQYLKILIKITLLNITNEYEIKLTPLFVLPEIRLNKKIDRIESESLERINNVSVAKLQNNISDFVATMLDYEKRNTQRIDNLSAQIKSIVTELHDNINNINTKVSNCITINEQIIDNLSKRMELMESCVINKSAQDITDLRKTITDLTHERDKVIDNMSKILNSEKNENMI